MVQIDLSKLPDQRKTKSFSIDLSKLPDQPKKKTKLQKLGGVAKGLGVGLLKSIGETASGGSGLVESALQAGTRAILPKSLESPRLSQTPVGTGLIQQGTFKPTSTSETIGKIGGDIAQFAIPASKVGQIPRGASLATRTGGAIKQGLLSGGMDLIQSGGERIGVAEGAIGFGAGMLLPNFARTSVNALKQAPQKTFDITKRVVTETPKAVKTAAREVVDPAFAAQQAQKNVSKRTLDFARKEAPKVGLPDNIVNTIKNASPEVKTKMQEIFEVSKQASSSKLAPRPIEVVGRQLVKEANKLQSAKTRIGGLINKEKQNIRKLGETIDPSSIKNTFQRQLEQQGVSFDEFGNIASFGRGIMNKGDQKMIGKVYKFISKPRSAEEVIDFNVGLFDELNLQKQSLNINKADALTQSVRNALKKKVGNINPNLNNLQKQYAEATQALGNFNKALGNNRYQEASIKNIKASELARRILNRNAGRPTQVIKDLLKANAKLEGKGELVSRKFANLQRQIELSDVLEDILNIAPSATFKKEVGKGVGQALGDMALDFVPAGNTLKAVTGLFGKEKNLRKEQLQLIQDLITKLK